MTAMKRTGILFLLTMLCAVCAQAQKPVAVYLQHLPVGRIGTDPDEAIIRDLKADGFLVVELDCAQFPRTSPELEEALIQYHLKTPETFKEAFPGEKIDFGTVMYVPAGYRVARNIPVWNIIEHGPKKVLDFVVKTHNEDMVKKYKVKPVTRAEEIRDVSGRPIDYTLYVDLIYPSGKPAKKVPLLLNYSSNYPRFFPFAPTDPVTARRAIFPIGFLTSGYAFANFDHCFNPLARRGIFGHINRYTLDRYCGVAYYTAGLRYIHSVLDDYNLNGRIGTMGISKASYAAVISANPNNGKMKEVSSEYGPVAPKQPHQGYPSTVDVAYAASGDGTWRIPDLVDERYAPMATSMGKLDKFTRHWPHYAVGQTHLDKVDNNHLTFWMEDMGHTYPGHGIDYPTGEPRYVLFKRFYDHHLKPAKEVGVLYILPREGVSDARTDGTHHWLFADEILPKDMKGVPRYAPVTVRFLPEMKAGSMDKFLQVVSRKTGKAVPGKWTASRRGTMYAFSPSAPLTAGERYAVRVLKGAPAVSGGKLTQTVEREFGVAGE